MRMNSLFRYQILVDPQDQHLVNSHSWFIANTYPAAKIDGKTIHLHKLILPNIDRVDHANRNKLDCRRSNLRAATGQQNSINRAANKNNNIGYKGVTARFGKFQAQITYNYTRYHLGTFATAEAAARKYDEAAVKYFGVYAYTNFKLDSQLDKVKESQL